MTDDRERLEHYLEWRRSSDRARAIRRRNWLVVTVVIFAGGTAAAGLIGWLADRASAPRDMAAVRPLERRARASITPDPGGPNVPESPAVTAPLSSPVEPAAPSPPPPPRQRAARDARARSTRSAPPARPRSDSTPRVVSPGNVPAAVHDRSDSEVAAAVASPSPAPPATSALPGTTTDNARRAEPLTDETRPAAPADATSEVPAPVTPQREDVVPQPTPPGRKPAVRERVAGWLKGEVQEFRDGVKREIGEFRSGYEKVRDAVQKLRPPSPER